MRSALAGIFPEHTLLFDVTPHGQPAGTNQVSVRVRHKQIRSPFTLQRLGVNQGEIGLELLCIEPVRLPEELKPGMTAPLELAGTSGVVELKPWPDDRITAVVAAIGQKVEAVWRSV